MRQRTQSLALNTLRAAAAKAAVQGLPIEAFEIAKRALLLSKELFGAESIEYLHCLEDFVASGLKSGNVDEVLSAQYEIIELRANLLGSDHPSVSFAMRTLAEALRASGNPVEAKRMEKRAGRLLASRLGFA